MTTPQEFNLPHQDFRKYQLDSIEFCLYNSGTTILEAPTGSGKTAIAAAIASKQSVVSLVRHKSLQMANYDHAYDFDAHYGKANYPCELGGTADLCEYDPKMYRCPKAGNCAYLLSKARAWGSARCSLNYAYWMYSHNWREQNSPQYLFCDEAHGLAQETIAHVSCTVTQKDIKEYSLPDLPDIHHRHPNRLLRLAHPVDMALPWLRDARDVMMVHYARLRPKAQASDANRQALQRVANLGRKIRNCYDSLQANREDWYIKSGNDALVYGNKTRAGFVCKPLTAKHDFARFFLNGHNTILTSATIGDFDDFTEELGIAEHNDRIVPNRYEPHQRPIYVLSDCPPMSSKATEQDFEHQADLIASFIRQYPPIWSGLIHVSRKKEEKLLADRLCQRGLGDRVWYIRGKQESYVPTDKQLQAWERRKQRVPNSILVTCSFGEGYDGLDERINIIAKIPFPLWGTEHSYDRAWATYSRSRYAARTGVDVEQRAGRTRRGRDQDYDINGCNGAVAIADGSLSRIQSKLSESFKESLC